MHYIPVATCLKSEHHPPDAFLIPSILFFLNLWVALLWKYLELLSPWIAHIAHDLWNHVLVSLSRSSFTSFLNPLNRDVLPKHESWKLRIVPCKIFFIYHAIFEVLINTRRKCSFRPYILGSFLFWSLHFYFTTFSP